MAPEQANNRIEYVVYTQESYAYLSRPNCQEQLINYLYIRRYFLRKPYQRCCCWRCYGTTVKVYRTKVLVWKHCRDLVVKTPKTGSWQCCCISTAITIFNFFWVHYYTLPRLPRLSPGRSSGRSPFHLNTISSSYYTALKIFLRISCLWLLVFCC